MTVAELLLTRQGLLSPVPGTSVGSLALLRALDVELASLGYALSARLRTQLSTLEQDDLARTRAWVWPALTARRGAGHRHEPLFRDFPRGVPEDTYELWIRKFLIYFVQAPEQPCLSCRRIGTTMCSTPACM